MNGLSNIFKGVSGQFESVRTLGGIGVLFYILCANGFEGWMVFGQSKPFDITAYCLAFPSGLGAAIAAIGLTAGSKDKSVAVATTVQNTGSLPAQPTQGASK